MHTSTFNKFSFLGEPSFHKRSILMFCSALWCGWSGTNVYFSIGLLYGDLSQKSSRQKNRMEKPRQCVIVCLSPGRPTTTFFCWGSVRYGWPAKQGSNYVPFRKHASMWCCCCCCCCCNSYSQDTFPLVSTKTVLPEFLSLPLPTWNFHLRARDSCQSPPSAMFFPLLFAFLVMLEAFLWILSFHWIWILEPPLVSSSESTR